VLKIALAKTLIILRIFLKFPTWSGEFDAIINNLNLIGYDLVLTDLIGTFLVLYKAAGTPKFRGLIGCYFAPPQLSRKVDLTIVA
jgi:hypothetical protein